MFYFEKVPSIKDLLIIRFDKYVDNRGFFAETYCSNVFKHRGIPELVQENCSCSKKNVIRGLHYQIDPCAIGKLVRCVKGHIFDVAVDIRKDSPTYGKYHSLELDESSDIMFWIPAGFAHGFCSMLEDSIISYKTSGYYSKDHERSIKWNDPIIGIQWPTTSPVVSEKDKFAMLLGLEDE